MFEKTAKYNSREVLKHVRSIIDDSMVVKQVSEELTGYQENNGFDLKKIYCYISKSNPREGIEPINSSVFSLMFGYHANWEHVNESTGSLNGVRIVISSMVKGDSIILKLNTSDARYPEKFMDDVRNMLSEVVPKKLDVSISNMASLENTLREVATELTLRGLKLIKRYVSNGGEKYESFTKITNLK